MSVVSSCIFDAAADVEEPAKLINYHFLYKQKKVIYFLPLLLLLLLFPMPLLAFLFYGLFNPTNSFFVVSGIFGLS